MDPFGLWAESFAIYVNQWNDVRMKGEKETEIFGLNSVRARETETGNEVNMNGASEKTCGKKVARIRASMKKKTFLYCLFAVSFHQNETNEMAKCTTESHIDMA